MQDIERFHKTYYGGERIDPKVVIDAYFGADAGSGHRVSGVQNGVEDVTYSVSPETVRNDETVDEEALAALRQVISDSAARTAVHAYLFEKKISALGHLKPRSFMLDPKVVEMVNASHEAERRRRSDVVEKIFRLLGLMPER